MNKDISEVLDDWEFDPENTVRFVDTTDGRQLVQVRLPMGMEQYHLEGRPDGARPFGHESMVDEIENRIAKFIKKHGEDSGYNIDHEAFALMQNEGFIYYQRYLVLFSIGDYKRTARDTAHNLRLCSLVEKYCTSKEDKKAYLQYKPYILRVNALSRAMVHLSKNEKTEALDVLDKAANVIEGMQNIGTHIFRIERNRSLDQLRKTYKQLQEYKIGVIDQLEAELQDAVDGEDYERAVELRDKIFKIKQRQKR